MKTEFEPYFQMNHVLDSYDSLMSYGLLVLNGNSHFTFWNGHHLRGWYYYLIDKDIAKAKQEFYVCGRLDEEVNMRFGSLTKNELMAGNINVYAMDANFHTMDVLLSDNKSLIERRAKLTYPERKKYMYKDLEPV